ncbi:hypothetical protein DQ04_03151010 [Trypanosoma grayi]|uniref:hypothetical protein n=1 Tax=Trypanosoma grayi TaxID=71804 RepID=UPI0004F3FB3B|nr:hypothetical protein DQ04_03151010 [Trypanosoma grayi]KEG10916.1 hypothetical protein DQ04_03151010 [Trypanosoma grayi]
MDAPQRSVESLTPLVGDCEVVLQRPVSYEPPMYLFPELLPKVPEGTAPISVSDAVADAVDVEASSLNIAELFRLPSMEFGAGGPRRSEADVASPTGDTPTPTPVTSLASLLASNRLQAAGISAEVLQRGRFSSGAIVEELLKLKDLAELNENEASALMSNHFINLLAWLRLVDINSQRPCGAGKEPSPALPQQNEESRQAKETQDAEVATLQPSSDPWSHEIDQHPGVFVAAAERNVERRVELLETLRVLYGRSWRTLQSQGVQTERFAPGAINETSPYVDPVKLPGAMLDPREDLGWSPRTTEMGAGSRWVLRVTSSCTTASEVIPLHGRFTNFGRSAGTTSAAHGHVAHIHFGLSAFTAHPEFLSPHHFSLAFLPVNFTFSGQKSGAAAQHKEGGAQENGKGEECLWLINYGRNGTLVVGKKWALGKVVKVGVGDVLQPTDDVRIVISTPLEQPEDGEEKVVKVTEVKQEPVTAMEE